MPIIPSMVLAVLVPWSAATAQGAEPAKLDPWPCRLIPTSASVRSLIDKGLERSETIRRQCLELPASRAVVVIEWGVRDSQSHARTAMDVRDGVVVATVKIPPLADNIVLLAHELQHVIEQTAGLDFRAEAKRVGSGVWESFDGYETQAAVDVSRRVADELRAYSKAERRRRNASASRPIDYFLDSVYKVVAMTDTAYLGEFEQLVLLSILRLGADASGASVATELEEQASRRVSRGALYTTLDRLEAKGLLRWKLALGGPERQSLPRRAYSVTPRGVEALRTSQRTLQRMWRGLDRVLKERP